MSVYVGIDVHRKRSQVAVIDATGKVIANRNVPNGAEPILKVIGGLPLGTPAAFEATYGTNWLVELLEDYGFAPHLVHPSRCKAIASARLKNDKVDATILAQLLRADLLPEPGLPRRRYASCGRCCATGSMPSSPTMAMTGRAAGTGAARAGPGSPPCTARGLPRAGRGRPGTDRRAAGADRPAGVGDPPARPVRPAGQGTHPAAGRGPVLRLGHPRRDRRREPVRIGAQAGVLGRAHADCAWQRPGRPLRAHLQTGLGVAALGVV